FQYPTSINGPGVGVATVAVGDFNGDAKPDLLTLNSGYSGLVSVLLGNGNGTFQPALFSGNSPYGVPRTTSRSAISTATASSTSPPPNIPP
ncbi:MAG TPA: FG-GAP repeat protein, partial [Gemmataceae bacterium]|nr:FG-GAP repeat protein [Gemmataceae bacterium]